MHLRPCIRSSAGSIGLGTCLENIRPAISRLATQQERQKKYYGWSTTNQKNDQWTGSVGAQPETSAKRVMSITHTFLSCTRALQQKHMTPCLLAHPWLLLAPPNSPLLRLAPLRTSWLLLLPAPPDSSCFVSKLQLYYIVLQWKCSFLRASSDSSWLLLSHPGCSWLFLAPPGFSWFLLAPPALGQLTKMRGIFIFCWRSSVQMSCPLLTCMTMSLFLLTMAPMSWLHFQRCPWTCFCLNGCPCRVCMCMSCM